MLINVVGLLVAVYVTVIMSKYLNAIIVAVC